MAEQIQSVNIDPDREPERPNNQKHFKHTPLNLHASEVRLFRLLSKENPSAPIQGELQHFNLSKAPKFKALSYTWGPPSPVSEIVINGRKFLVRENLYAFFEAAQTDLNYDINSWIWVDQVSIDQSWVLERNHQVSQMAEIYRSASEVIVWLGPDKNFEGVPVNFVLQNSSDLTMRSLRDALIRLLHCKYWFRTWIIQEFLLATSIVIFWGKTRLTLKELEDLIKHGGHNLHRHCHFPSLRPRMDKISYLLSQKKLKDEHHFLHWTQALVLSQMTECEDTRDRIYALLGLVLPSIAIEVDYSATPQEILDRILDINVDQGFRLSPSFFCEQFALTRAHVGRALGLGNEPSLGQRARNLLLRRLLRVEEGDLFYKRKSPGEYNPLEFNKNERNANILDQQLRKQMVLQKLRDWIRDDPTPHSNQLPAWFSRYQYSAAVLCLVARKNGHWQGNGSKQQDNIFHFLRKEYNSMMARNDNNTIDDSSWEVSSARFFDDMETQFRFDFFEVDTYINQYSQYGIDEDDIQEDRGRRSSRSERQSKEHKILLRPRGHP